MKYIDINQKMLELRQKMDKETRLAWIVETCLETLKCGETFDANAILEANPDIADELKTRFELAGILPLTYEITKVPTEVWEKTKACIIAEYDKLCPAKEILKVSEIKSTYGSPGVFVAEQRRKLRITPAEAAKGLGISEDDYRCFEGDRKSLPEQLWKRLAEIIKVSYKALEEKLSQPYKIESPTFYPIAARKKGPDKKNRK